MKGILGRKIGMTQVFLDNDKAVSVTIIDVKPNVVTNIFTKEKDKYVATQLATDSYSKKKLHSNKISKPFLGQFKKANTTPKRFVKEIRGMNGFEIGTTIKADLFKAGEYVDISG
jgi:large subunit ribosomal protein L3